MPSISRLAARRLEPCGRARLVRDPRPQAGLPTASVCGLPEGFGWLTNVTVVGSRIRGRAKTRCEVARVAIRLILLLVETRARHADWEELRIVANEIGGGAGDGRID